MDVIVVIGPGQIGQAITRRVGPGKHVLLADMRRENADAAAEILGNAGYAVSVATVDVSSRETVNAVVEMATDRATLSDSSIPQVSRQVRRDRRRFSKSICTA